MPLIALTPADIDYNGNAASRVFGYDTKTDFPAMAADLSAAPYDFGTGWYCSGLSFSTDENRICTVHAKRPGSDWTWIGLTPIESTEGYFLPRKVQLDSGAIKYGFWRLFSNWPAGSNWVIGGILSAIEPNNAWRVSWVSATNRYAWRHSTNPAVWNDALVPPEALTAGWFCREINIETIKYAVHATGAVATAYRHEALFWLAPTRGETQLLWVFPSWTPD